MCAAKSLPDGRRHARQQRSGAAEVVAVKTRGGIVSPFDAWNREYFPAKEVGYV